MPEPEQMFMRLVRGLLSCADKFGVLANLNSYIKNETMTYPGRHLLAEIPLTWFFTALTNYPYWRKKRVIMTPAFLLILIAISHTN